MSKLLWFMNTSHGSKITPFLTTWFTSDIIWWLRNLDRMFMDKERCMMICYCYCFLPNNVYIPFEFGLIFCLSIPKVCYYSFFCLFCTRVSVKFLCRVELPFIGFLNKFYILFLPIGNFLLCSWIVRSIFVLIFQSENACSWKKR